MSLEENRVCGPGPVLSPENVSGQMEMILLMKESGMSISWPPLQSTPGSNYQRPTVKECNTVDEKLNEDSEYEEKSLPSFENPAMNSAGSIRGCSRRTPSLPEHKAYSTSHDAQSHIYRGLHLEDQDYDGIPVADLSLSELYLPDVDLESLTLISATKLKYPKNSKMHGFLIKVFVKGDPFEHLYISPDIIATVMWRITGELASRKIELPSVPWWKLYETEEEKKEKTEVRIRDE